MSLVVATEPSSLVVVEDNCSRMEAWAETCTNVAELRDLMNKCSAMSEYLRLTSVEGVARIETAKRRLEVRIGVLLGPPRSPSETGRGKTSDHDQKIDSATVSTFRAMAADPDTVEEVIAASTDEQPPSRRKVMDAIKSKRTKRTEEDMLKKLGRAAVEARVAKATEMAAAGYTSRQIAEAIGIDAGGGFTNFKKRHGIEVPADAVTGRTHLHNSDRMVSETVATLEGVAMTLDLVGHPADAGLDPDKIAGWATSLTASLTALTRFNKQLKEMTQ